MINSVMNNKSHIANL